MYDHSFSEVLASFEVKVAFFFNASVMILFKAIRTICPRMIRPRTICQHKLILAPPDSSPQALGYEPMSDWQRQS
jgi:hypothetical protein